MDRRTLVVALVAAEIAILLMAAYAIRSTGQWHESRGPRHVTTRVEALRPGGSVSVSLPGAVVALRPSPDERVHVTERSSKTVPLQVETGSEGLRIWRDRAANGGFTFGFNPSDIVDIAVPQEAPVEVVGERITATGMRAALSLHAEDGSVRVSDQNGDLHILADDGRIYLDRVSAQNVHAESRSGRIVATALTLRGAEPKLEATTADGRIELAVKQLPADGRYLVHTDNGPIRLRIPSDSDVTIAMSSEDGTITATGTQLSGEGRERRAVLGTGRATFQASTRDGSINLIAGILE